jgi:hypothetical protein
MRVLSIAAGAILLTASSHAQPPPQGWIGALAPPSILCDTSAEVQSIVDAFDEGADAGKARLLELYKLMNVNREPTCAVVEVKRAMTSESTELGRVKIADANYFGWIVHIKSGAAEGYYLYLETPQEALKNAI